MALIVGWLADRSDRGVISSGESVWYHMLLPRYVFDLEPVHERPQLKAHESGVWNLFQVLLVPQYSNQRFMIHAEDEILQPQDEKSAFI